MKLDKNLDVKARQADVWSFIENPVEAIANNQQQVEATAKSDNEYEFKIPHKMGLLKLKINCALKFLERRPQSYCKFEFQANIPGGKLNGNGEMTLKAKSETSTTIHLLADVSSGGIISGMLGGEKATEDRLSGIIEQITTKLSQPKK